MNGINIDSSMQEISVLKFSNLPIFRYEIVVTKFRMYSSTLLRKANLIESKKALTYSSHINHRLLSHTIKNIKTFF